jgi:predicted site-specific integrase-resolvase
MPVLINGTEYLSAAEMMRELGISRQTLYRWRQEGKVPSGHRFRDGKILFTREQADEIRDFALHVERADVARDQMRLFKRSTS